MLFVLVSWIIIAGICLILGYGMIHYGYRHTEKNYLDQLDVYLVCGLMMVNIYAEVFSLFYKVGAKACLGLMIIGIVVVITYCFKNRGGRKNVFHRPGLSTYQWIVVLFVCICMLVYTVGKPVHYDTMLYHFQAIKWIEEYGVVPGLGNLHNRFAYNSAFMPLQALFSLEWLIGQSLHTVNGFVTGVFLIYAIITNQLWNGKIRLSDLFKVMTCIYVCYTRGLISSPSSDILPMLLILYICTKWCELIESDVTDSSMYGFLCILGVYTITLKLSAAVCVILAIWPTIKLIQEKKWKEIVLHIVGGLVIVIPWLARNVIISGYLLYPYPQIDLFDVDWKMPASVLEYDSREIIAWGRDIFSVEKKEALWEWVPHWFDHSMRTLIVLGFVCGMIWLVTFISRTIKKKIDMRQDILGIYGILALLSWFFSAPLMRYGMVYLLIPVCLCAQYCIKMKKGDLFVKAVIMVVLIPVGVSYLGSMQSLKDQSPIMQDDYEWNLTEEMELAPGVKVWIPVKGDQCSADVFPCVPYRKMVERVELRGTTLKDGFRIKAEYSLLHLNAYGNEWTE